MHPKRKLALANQRQSSMHAVAASKSPMSAKVFYHSAAGGVNVHEGPNPWHSADGDAATTGITDTGSSASAATPPFVDPSQIPVDTTAAPTTTAAATPAPAPCGCGHENHKMVCFGAGVVVGVVLALLLTRAD